MVKEKRVKAHDGDEGRENRHASPRRIVSHPKGYVYTLEVLLAVSIVFLTMVFAFKVPEFSSDATVPSLKDAGEEALRTLDERGTLRSILLGNDEQALYGNLSALLPTNAAFAAAICTPGCAEPPLPEKRTVVVVRYYIAGDNEHSDPAAARIWLWPEV